MSAPRIRRGVGLHDWWILLPPLSIGVFAWAAFFYIGLRARRRSWLIAAGVYLSALFIAYGIDAAAGSADWSSTLAGFVLFSLAAGGLAHAIAVRSRFYAAISGMEEVEYEAAERRLKARELARKIVAEEPERARQLGIGRPDLKDAFDASLVDLNSAPANAIAAVTGVTLEVARRIVDAREQTDGDFESVEDLDLLLDLPVDDVARLEDASVCVPTS